VDNFLWQLKEVNMGNIFKDVVAVHPLTWEWEFKSLVEGV
jgi:hypothetical protein